MKNLVLVVSLLIATSASAQFNLAHEFQPSDLASNFKFNLVYIDDDLPVYVSWNNSPSGGLLRLFNMDFVFVNEINIPFSPAVNNVTIHYITRTLFDCDPDNIEFLLSYPFTIAGGGSGSKVQVMREDGTILFEESGSVTLASISYLTHSIQHPIMSTPDGARLFLYMTDQSMGDSGIRVYDLCGDLPSMCCVSGGDSNIPTHSGGVDYVHYGLAAPNPTTDFVSVKLSEPVSGSGVVLMVFNQKGQMVQTVNVNPGVKEISIDLGNQSAGTYIYRIMDESGVLDTGKVVKQ